MALSRTVTVLHVVHILHILWRRLFRELTFFFLWKDVRESWIFPFYALDCLSYLSITLFVLVCNLYIVFVASATPHDMITSTVTLNFIFDRLPHFKRTLLDGSSGKRLLAGLRKVHKTGPKHHLWRIICTLCVTTVPRIAEVSTLTEVCNCFRNA